MQFHHSHLAGRTATILPMVDQSYPRHGAFLSIRQDGRAIYSAVQHDMPEAVQYLRIHGYIVPVGI